MSNGILYITESLEQLLDPEILSEIKQGASNCFFEVQSLGAFCQLPKKSRDPNPPFILIDPQTLSDLFELTSFVVDAFTIVVTLEKDNPSLEAYASRLQDLRYVVGKSTPYLMAGTICAILEFHVTKTVRGVLPRIMSLDLIQSLNMELQNTAEKATALDSVVQFFEDEIGRHKEKLVSGTSSYPRNLSYIADELLMNSIWDASKDRVHADRSLPQELPDGQEVQLECACDGQFLALSVSDTHGTFPVQARFRPIKHALGMKVETSINHGPGGAGLGLSMILQKIHLLCYEIKKGSFTRAIALLRSDLSMRELQKLPKTVIFLELDEEPISP